MEILSLLLVLGEIFFLLCSECLCTSTPQTLQLAKSINRLSIDFHRAVESFEENVIFSPLSVSIGLALLLEGSQGDTRRELMKFLADDVNSTNTTAIKQAFKGVSFLGI